MHEKKHAVPWKSVECSACRAQPGEECRPLFNQKEGDEDVTPCHYVRFFEAKRRLPESVKAAIMDAFCPTCRALAGEPCKKVDKDMWHRGRDWLIVDQHARQPSRLILTCSVACADCGSEPGEPCYTHDFTDSKNAKRAHKTRAERVPPRPLKSFHSIRITDAAKKYGFSPKRFPLNEAYKVRCPVCNAAPEDPCLRTTRDSDVGEGFIQLPAEEWTVPTKRPHWPRWERARAVAEGGLEIDPETELNPPPLSEPELRRVSHIYEESCTETGLHAELAE